MPISIFHPWGGVVACTGTSDNLEDQIEVWGSGPATNTGNFGPSNGNPQIWSGAPGAMNCNGPNNHELVRNYYPPASALVGAQQMEWGFNFTSSPVKSTFWQQAIVAQYQCNPVSACGVTVDFSQGNFNGAPPGWFYGMNPPFQSTWAEGSGGVSATGNAYGPCNAVGSQILNRQPSSGPGTITVNLCTYSPGSLNNLGGIVWDVNPDTGTGYGMYFYDAGTGNNGSFAMEIAFGNGGVTINTPLVNAYSSPNPLQTCPTWVQLVIAANNQFILYLANTRAGLSTAVPVTFIDNNGLNYNSGYMGLISSNCPDISFSSFEWDGACGASTATPTPTVEGTPTESFTSTPGTPTSTPTNSPTVDGTPTNSPTVDGTQTSTYTWTPGTPTNTFTFIPTITLTPTVDGTPTNTPTNTSGVFTYTPTPTSTYTLSPTADGTPTRTSTQTVTPTVTFTPTFVVDPYGTVTETYTPTSTIDPTPNFFTSTYTWTPTITPSPTTTPTPTWTPTYTVTPTPSGTPTAANASPTVTPTPGTGGKLCGPPYPNPCDGKHPVCFNVQAQGNCTVTYDVFTTAYKKVATHSVPVSCNTTLSWDCADKAGGACSNGLYYIRVTVNSAGSAASQIIKVLILR